MVWSRSSPGCGPAAKLHFYCLLLTMCLWTHVHFPVTSPAHWAFVLLCDWKKRESSTTVVSLGWRHRGNMWHWEIVAAAGVAAATEIKRLLVSVTLILILVKEVHGADISPYPPPLRPPPPHSKDRPALLAPKPRLFVPDGWGRWQGRRGSVDLQEAKNRI